MQNAQGTLIVIMYLVCLPALICSAIHMQVI